ncbi:replication initiation protein, RepL2 [Streptomyces sp. NPDC051173]|uniref:replication initiation protein, RepL2 n=1 Tax=Streptomyces sp. NPDC051173 TaxID=3155164 RepID=UPI00344E2240
MSSGDLVALTVLRRTRKLKPNQRLLLQLYALAPKAPNGAVKRTAAALAEELGWTPSLFSRVRKELVKEGWLEEVDRVTNIPIYRLGEESTGERRVVPLRSA